jgi:hypothetical protein
VNYGFGWMKVVFDWWVMFRMMFIIKIGKNLIDLVKIGWRYEGLKFDGYGGFREKFEGRKMFVCENEGRRREKFVL